MGNRTSAASYIGCNLVYEQRQTHCRKLRAHWIHRTSIYTLSIVAKWFTAATCHWRSCIDWDSWTTHVAAHIYWSRSDGGYNRCYYLSADRFIRPCRTCSIWFSGYSLGDCTSAFGYIDLLLQQGICKA